jgi:cytoskeletal protein CcmA (bactofilin family)
MKCSRTHWSRWALVALLGLTLVVAIGATQMARAVEIDDDGFIAADEVIDDDVFINSETVVVDGTVNGNLFASGGSVTINGTVGGDLIVTGSEVTVNGLVNGNLAFFGGELSVDGTVEGSIYVLGGSLILESQAAVGRNVSFTGFGMETEPGSTIGRDLQVSGYQALLAGRVDQDVNAEVVALEIEGSVGGDVMAQVSKPGQGPLGQFQWPGMPAMVDPGLRVAEEAQIGGTLTYVSPVEQADTIESLPDGGVVHQLPTKPEMSVPLTPEKQVASWLLARAQDCLTLLVLGGLALWWAPALLKRLAEQARARPLPSAGWGLVVMIAGGISVVVLAALILVLGILMGAVTLGGLAGAVFGVGFSGLALAFALFLLAITYGSKLIVAYMAGRLALQRLAPRRADGIWPLVLGVVLYVLLRSIPILGWFIGVIVTFVGLGAMWLLFRGRRSVPAPVAGNDQG